MYTVKLRVKRGNDHVKTTDTLREMKAHIKKECACGEYVRAEIFGTRNKLIISAPIDLLPLYGYEIQ